MAKEKIPMTQALRQLKAEGVDYTVMQYRYEDKGGSETAARELGLDEHLVIKTLVFENEKKSPLVVLMHGDFQVSTKNLAREVGAKTITPCNPEIANKHTGYQVGGISPFGLRVKMPIYAEASILDLEKIYINAGKRGMLVEIPAGELERVLKAAPVNVALK